MIFSGVNRPIGSGEPSTAGLLLRLRSPDGGDMKISDPVIDLRTDGLASQNSTIS